MKTLSELQIDLDEALNIAQRLKRKRTFQKNKAKILRGKKIKRKRLADRETLLKRASKQARAQVASKLSGGKKKEDLALAQRQAIEVQVDKRKGAVQKIAKRLFPKIRKKEIERLKKFRSKK